MALIIKQVLAKTGKNKDISAPLKQFLHDRFRMFFRSFSWEKRGDVTHCMGLLSGLIQLEQCGIGLEIRAIMQGNAVVHQKILQTLLKRLRSELADTRYEI